jgi:vitamin B12 transporter
VQKSFAGDPKNPFNIGDPTNPYNVSNIVTNPDATCGLNCSAGDTLIGGFSPLVGARPFRVAPHSAFVAVDWSTKRFTVRTTGIFVSRRDDSDFLAFSDINFGNSLVLPNRNLDPAYQRIDVYAAFRINPRTMMYTTMENLLNERYYESFGYPALPFTIRSGVQFRFGGESWKL